MLLSMALGTAANASYAISMSVVWVMVGRVLWGAAWSGIWVGAHALLLDTAEVEERGRLSGRFQLWFFTGVGTMALAGGALTDAIGFRSALWVSTASSALALLIWGLFLPEVRVDATGPPEDGRETGTWASIPWRAALAASLPYFSIRVTAAGVLASTTILWLGGYFEEGIDLGGWQLPLATLTGAVVALRTIAGIGGGPASGWLSDRLQRRWGVMAGILLIGALGLALMTAPTFGAAIIGALLVALMGPGVQALSPSIIGDRAAAAERGRALAVVFTVGDLGSAIGPPLALGLLSTTSIQAVYIGCSALLLTSAVFAAVTARGELPIGAH